MKGERRPRVLMVDSERAWRGGQAQVRLLMKGLAQAGAEVALAAPADGALFGRAADVERIAWDARPLSWWRLRRAISAGGYDVVHSHASRAHGAAALARLGITPRPAHVVSRRVVDRPGRGAASLWKYRHGADGYIAISSHVRAVLAGAGIPAARIALVRDGIDLEQFGGGGDAAALRAEFGIDGATRIVGSIAALTPEKAHADLLRAAARVLAERGDVRFLIVGAGALGASLQGLARELGIADRVIFAGFRDDAAHLLRVFDVFVLCPQREGLGTSIMDAQAAGVPVVATRAGGIPEIVVDGESGLLVAPGSPHDLAGAILRMLGDGGLRERCTRTALEQSRGYDYHEMVYRTLDVYRRLCPTLPISPTKDAP